MKKFVIFIVFTLFLSCSCPVLAQEDSVLPETTSSVTEINIPPEELGGEEITIDDLGVEEPSVYPGHWAYGFKKAWQNLRTAFTFRAENKARLQARYLNEDLVGVSKCLEKEISEQKRIELIKIYQQRAEKLEETIDEISSRVSESEDVQQLIEWLAQNQLKHIAVLDSLADKVPEQAAQSLSAVKERHIERIISKIETLESSGKIENVLEKITNIEEIKTQSVQRIREEIQVRQEMIQDFTPEQREMLNNVIKESVQNRLQEETRNRLQEQSEIKEEIEEESLEEEIEEEESQENGENDQSQVQVKKGKN